MEEGGDEKKGQPGELLVQVPLQAAEAPKDEEEALTVLQEKPKKSWKFAVLLCSVWFLATICNTFLVKTFEIATGVGLSRTIVAVQLASISLYSCMFNIVWGVPKNKKQVSWKIYAKLVPPIVISILLRVGYNERTIWTTPIGDPYSLGAEAFFLLWMFFLSIILLPGEDNGNHRSTVLIAILGASLLLAYVCTSFEHSLTKIIAYAVGSAFELTCSKKIMKETGIHPTKLLSVISGLVFLCYLPIWIIQLNWLSHSPYLWSILTFQWLMGVFVFGALSWVQTLTAFSLLSESTVQHYLVASASNRIARILVFMLIVTFYKVGLRPRDFNNYD